MPKKKSKKQEIKEENIEQQESPEVRRKREEKQTRVVFFGMVLLIVFFISFIIFYRQASTFTYEGLKFEKVRTEGGLALYKTTLQFARQEGVFSFDLYFRNDPKQLEDIPFNASIILRNRGFVSFDPRVSSCYGSNIPAVELGTFLGALGMKVQGATTDANVSEEKGVDLKRCEDAVNATIIILQESDYNGIEQDGECYILNIANCNVLPVAEKFIFETTLQLVEKTKQTQK